MEKSIGGRKMTVKEFFESKEKLAIHCDTRRKAKKLLDAFDEAGYCWGSGIKYKDYILWAVVKENTCYDNRGKYEHIEYYKYNGHRILEFEEIELEDTSESKGEEQMIASHYEVEAYDCNDNILATARAFSFDFNASALSFRIVE